MRDTLKTVEHWVNMNISFEDDWEFHNEMLDEMIATDGEDSESAKRARLFLKADCIGRICDLYSSGSSIEEIVRIFPTLVDLMTKTWSSNDSSYIELMWVFSLGVLLNAPAEDFEALHNKLKDEEYNDFLIDYLFEHIVKTEINIDSELMFASPYEYLISAIHTDSKEDATVIIKTYVQKIWYQGHSDAGWHNSHKKKDGFYHGYWSFEAAAIAKILSVNDTGWENMQYYPYDLVHYTD